MTGTELIAKERERQVGEEGWTPEHDDTHVMGELQRAATAYLTADIAESVDFFWPWQPRHWKPSDDPVRNLTKAGALIAAEIDRLQRLELPVGYIGYDQGGPL